MREPDFKRAFASEDFRGYFSWTQTLTNRLGGSLFHACHEEELLDILDAGVLNLRSKWKLKLPIHGMWEAPGTWVGLNYFTNGNHYGPFLLKFPLAVLNGRRFMVFRRIGEDRRRYFFTQYEARIPVYNYGNKLWRTVNPEHYFDKGKDGDLIKKSGAIYDLVITTPLPLDDVIIKAVDHPSCISCKCAGTTRAVAMKAVKRIAVDRFREELRTSSKYARFVKRFPVLEGISVTLPEL